MEISIEDVVICNRCGILLSKNYIGRYSDTGKYLDTSNDNYYSCPLCQNEMTTIGENKK